MILKANSLKIILDIDEVHLFIESKCVAHIPSSRPGGGEAVVSEVGAVSSLMELRDLGGILCPKTEEKRN